MVIRALRLIGPHRGNSRPAAATNAADTERACYLEDTRRIRPARARDGAAGTATAGRPVVPSPRAPGNVRRICRQRASNHRRGRAESDVRPPHGARPGVPGTRAQRLHAPPRPLRVQPARRPRADQRDGGRGRGARLRFARDHRPRCAVRRGRLLSGDDREEHQADHRGRDVRRPPVHAGQGRQGGQPAVPPDPPREELAGLPEPLPARDRCARRRLLLQAADRQGAPREVQRGPGRPIRVPQRRGRTRARDRGLGSRAACGRRVLGHLWARRFLP